MQISIRTVFKDGLQALWQNITFISLSILAMQGLSLVLLLLVRLLTGGSLAETTAHAVLIERLRSILPFELAVALPVWLWSFLSLIFSILAIYFSAVIWRIAMDIFVKGSASWDVFKHALRYFPPFALVWLCSFVPIILLTTALYLLLALAQSGMNLLLLLQGVLILAAALFGFYLMYRLWFVLLHIVNGDGFIDSFVDTWHETGSIWPKGLALFVLISIARNVLTAVASPWDYKDLFMFFIQPNFLLALISSFVVALVGVLFALWTAAAWKRTQQTQSSLAFRVEETIIETMSDSRA